jgi:outer membrane protein OmpA-like peptidoglycan-associated protein
MKMMLQGHAAPAACGRAGRSARRTIRLAALLALLAAPAMAQPAFNCVGAEQVEDDVFSIPFARGSARVTDAARAPLAAAEEALNAAPGRVACILGHAGQEGGATTSIRLAAERARAVSTALGARGIAAERLRAEARSAQFSPRVRQAEPPSRTVTIVVLPAP